MSYTKQTWAAGDKITSSKLNHMEDGIAAANTAIPLIVTEEGFTYNELLTAITANQPVYLKSVEIQEDEFKYTRVVYFIPLSFLNDDHEFEDENTTVVSCVAEFLSGTMIVQFTSDDMDKPMVAASPK